MLTSEDILVVTNKGDTDVEFRAGGRVTTVPAGSAKQVPFDAVRIAMGDPRSAEGRRVAILPNGDKVMIPARADELSRLDLLYGIATANQVSQQKGETPTATLAAAAPDVTVTTVDGTPVDTPVSDPSGANPAPVPVDLDSPESLTAQMLELQRQMDAVNARLGAAQPADAAPDTEVKEDTPTSKTTKS